MTKKEQTLHFFESLELLTKRFFSEKNIDLEQLRKIALKGEVDQTVLMYKGAEPWRQIGEISFNGQDILILKMTGTLGQKELTDLLSKRDYKPIIGLETDESNKVGKHLEELRQQTPISTLHACVGKETNSSIFLISKYMFPVNYAPSRKGSFHPLNQGPLFFKPGLTLLLCKKKN